MKKLLVNLMKLLPTVLMFQSLAFSQSNGVGGGDAGLHDF